MEIEIVIMNNNIAIRCFTMFIFFHSSSDRNEAEDHKSRQYRK